ncbi:MAG: hypothetical protein FWD45_04395 [Coriobacteriia bacterium]|nr:hypothetical protein [Coriobacteriia bacterium]
MEKVADYIVYIHKGQIIYSGTKDELIERYCLVRGGNEELDSVQSKGGFGL